MKTLVHNWVVHGVWECDLHRGVTNAHRFESDQEEILCTELGVPLERPGNREFSQHLILIHSTLEQESDSVETRTIITILHLYRFQANFSGATAEQYEHGLGEVKDQRYLAGAFENSVWMSLMKLLRSTEASRA